MVECDADCENLIGCGQGVEVKGYLYCCQQCANKHQKLRNKKVPHKNTKEYYKDEDV